VDVDALARPALNEGGTTATGAIPLETRAAAHYIVPMSRASSSLPILLPIAAVACACSSNDNPQLTDVAKQYGAAYCVKLEECMGSADFEAAYPGGQDDCAAQTFSIHGTNERSICTQEKWDECTEDLEDSTCVESDAGVRPKVPDSCEGC